MRERGLRRTLAPMEVSRMSRRRKLGIGILAASAGILTVSAIGVALLVESLRPMGEWFDSGYLGPADQRQRIEVPAHGFAVSFADDWSVTRPLPEPQDAERSGLLAVLVAVPPEGAPILTVQVAPGAGSVPGEELLRRWAEEHGSFGDPGIFDGWAEMPGGAVGMAFQDEAGSLIAAWVVPHGDDALMLSTIFQADEGLDEPEWNSEGMMLRFGMWPIAESFESLPAEG
jgi:hypothetical protein